MESYEDEVAYRLHERKDYPQDYDSSEGELKERSDQLGELESDHHCVYCQFHNFKMYDNIRTINNRLEE